MMSKLLGDRYLLGAMIGTGGMADVYTAQDQRLSREVAVKILRSDLAQDPSFVSRFRKEAKAAAGLNHPGIVAVYDSGEDPAPYIVMELVEGHTLRELIHEGERIECDRALEIIVGVLEALDYSHMRGIVHRLITNPLIISISMGVVFSAFDLHLPVPFNHAVDMLSGASAPVALFYIGCTLAGLSLKASKYCYFEYFPKK